VGAPKTDPEHAYDALTEKRARYDLLYAYYEGNQPLVYSTERLSDIFRKIEARWVQNWVSVVVDAALERLTFKGFEVDETAGGTPEASKRLMTLAAGTDLEIEAYDAHKDALITGEGFLLAWPDEENGFDLYANDPRMVHMFYEPDRPKVPEFAAKWWAAEGATLLNLYYLDRIEHWVGPKNPRSGRSFLPLEDGGLDERGEPIPSEPVEENPYGTIPVFHFRMSRRGPGGEIGRLTSPQDGVNKLLADMMVTSEFGSFPQRWAITEQDTSKLKIGPGQLWSFTPGDEGVQPTQVGSFDSADPRNYTEPLNMLATHIAIISRTPKHYFYGQGGDPSGEALIAMEAPLTKKCQHYSELFGQVWRELGAFLLDASGISVPPGTISAVWDTMDTQQPLNTTTALVNYIKAGLPLATALRELGWGPDEIAQMEDDKAAEPATPTLGSAMQTFDQGVPGAYPTASPAAPSTPLGTPPS